MISKISCCDEIMNLTLCSEDGVILLYCPRCGSETTLNIQDKIEMCKFVEDYLKVVKKSIMHFENIRPNSTIKITGIKKNGEKVIAYTGVTEYNKEQVSRDVGFIKQLNNTSLILGDDVPSLFIPFEEEGLACSKMIVEEIKF